MSGGARKITVFGSSGFIGRHLVAKLRDRGDTVIEGNIRSPEAPDQCQGSDTVVNLAGAPAAVRWTAAHKAEIMRSRVDLPRMLIDRLGQLPSELRPRRYVSASAIGYYGTSKSDTFTEASAPGNDFLAEVCVGWEREAARAGNHDMKVSMIRTGLVLGTDGGMLKPLLPVFKLGLGGPVASGQQWFSWIHIDDQVGIYTMAIDGTDGILNATAPEPVSNAVFAKSLASALSRPGWFRTPALLLRAAFGEGAYMMTEGQRVLPARTMQSGYQFKYPQINGAARAIAAR